MNSALIIRWILLPPNAHSPASNTGPSNTPIIKSQEGLHYAQRTQPIQPPHRRSCNTNYQISSQDRRPSQSGWVKLTSRGRGHFAVDCRSGALLGLCQGGFNFSIIHARFARGWFKMIEKRNTRPLSRAIEIHKRASSD